MDTEAIPRLVEQVAKLERKLAKQRKRLDRIVRTRSMPGSAAGTEAARAPTGTARPAAVAVGGPSAADVIASAEREATEIRRAARRDRARFRDELVDLLTRLAPMVEDDDLDDDID